MLPGMKLPIHDFKGLTDWFPVFIGGEQTDARGNTHNWTDDDLDQIVTNSNQRIADNIYSGAPLVVGHPKTDDPAFGWVESVKRVGSTLYAKATKLHDKFAEGVQSGLWPNRSVRIGKDDNGHYLRHIGFLGGKPPAVEGMDPVYNQDTEATEGEVFDFEADVYTPNALSRMMRRMRDFLIEQFGLERADAVMPEWDIDSLSEHATNLRESMQRDSGNETVPAFSKPDQTNQPGEEDMSGAAGATFTQADLDAARQAGEQSGRETAQADFATQQQQRDQEHQAALQAERDRIQFSADVSGWIGEHITPAQAEGMAEFMLALPTGDNASFEFSAGDGDNATTVSKSPRDWFRQFVANLKSPVDLGSPRSDGDQLDIDDAKALAQAAVEFQKSQADKGITISVTQAVNHVKQQHGGQ